MQIVYFKNGSHVFRDDLGCWIAYSKTGVPVESVSYEKAINCIFENYLLIESYSKESKKEYENLKKQLEDEKKYSKRLNLEAQRWFDIAMDLMKK